MSPFLASLLVLAPLMLYLLHALWRLIASDHVISLLSAVFAYCISALLFRLLFPTLPLMPLWLPLLYGYLWLGLTGVLVMIACGNWRRDGLQLQGLSLKMSCYLMAQSSLLGAMLLLNNVLSDRPLAALAALPPFVAMAGYLLYRVLLRISAGRARIAWWAMLLPAVAMVLVLCWGAEMMVPQLLRHL